MQAMNGSGGLTVRRLLHLVGCVAALVALSAMAVPSIAAAKTKKTKVTSTYLSLGDSLAFGYSQQLLNENAKNGENPVNFEHGFANDYLGLVNEKASKQGQLVNLGCPGETSESLIGDNPALLAEMNKLARKHISEPITGEAPCAYHYTDGLPLHHEYGGSESQLESAIETIKAEKAAGKPVRDISLDIGANDELHEVAAAEKEAKEAVEEKVGAIVTPEAEAAVAAKVNAAVEKEIIGWLEEKVGYQAYVESGGVEPALKEDFEKTRVNTSRLTPKNMLKSSTTTPGTTSRNTVPNSRKKAKKSARGSLANTLTRTQPNSKAKARSSLWKSSKRISVVCMSRSTPT